MLGDLHEVAHQVEELLPRGQRIHQPGRHQRRSSVVPLFDPALGDHNGFSVLPGIAKHHRVGTLLEQQPGHGSAIVRDDRHGFVSLLDHLRRVEDRFDQLNVGHVLADRRQDQGRGAWAAPAPSLT